MVSHEETEKEILRLVTESQGSDRAMLLIVYRMHQELIANTEATRLVSIAAETHTVTLANHAAEEMALINQMRGGWKVAVWSLATVAALLGVIQGLALREVSQAREQITTNTARLHVLEKDNVLTKERMDIMRNGKPP